MTEITLTLPDELAEEVLRLADPQEFLRQAVADALSQRGTSKWVRLVKEIENLPGLGEYNDAFNRSRREFREGFRFKHDEPDE
jgi:hypothetical protein